MVTRYSRLGSPYIGHPNNKLPGIEMNSGSLGHGLPVCVGIAKGLKMDGRTNRVYTLMGDGELAEGSVWLRLTLGSSEYSGIVCRMQDDGASDVVVFSAVGQNESIWGVKYDE